jgi:hypothetical protein
MKARKSFLLRIAPELYREVEAWAQQELRSVNGQIEFLLKEAVARRRGLSPPRSAPDDSRQSAAEDVPGESTESEERS